MTSIVSSTAQCTQDGKYTPPVYINLVFTSTSLKKRSLLHTAEVSNGLKRPYHGISFSRPWQPKVDATATKAQHFKTILQYLKEKRVVQKYKRRTTGCARAVRGGAQKYMVKTEAFLSRSVELELEQSAMLGNGITVGMWFIGNMCALCWAYSTTLGQGRRRGGGYTHVGKYTGAVDLVTVGLFFFCNSSKLSHIPEPSPQCAISAD